MRQLKALQPGLGQRSGQILAESVSFFWSSLMCHCSRLNMFDSEHVFLQLHLKPLFSSLMVGMAEKTTTKRQLIIQLLLLKQIGDERSGLSVIPFLTRGRCIAVLKEITVLQVS